MSKEKMKILGTIGTIALTASFSALGQQFIVKLKDTQSLSKSVSILSESQQLNVKEIHPEARLALVDIPDSVAVAKTMRALGEQVEYEYIVSNYKLRAFYTPDDPKFAEQWALKKVKAGSAWNEQRGDRSIVIAVIDTGVDWKHEDLKDRIWVNPKEIAGNGQDDDGDGYIDDVRGWDFFDKDADPNDDVGSANPGHGTHCAGIIAATGDNGLGISGLAPKVTIMPIRFLGADGSGSLLDGIKAIDYAIAHGAHIISASWGAPVSREQARPLIEAIERAEAKGILFIAAAANDGQSNDKREVYPANAGLANVISVAASDVNDTKPRWSNYGRATVDLASPGANILSTIPGDKYRQLSGTSMATPLTAGAAGLLLSEARAREKKLAPEHVKALLQASGDKVAIETACDCRIDADRALTHLRSERLTIVPNAATVAIGAERSFSAIGGSGPYTFKSSDPAVATITAEGILKGLSAGQTTISVSDSKGELAKSHTIWISPTQGETGQCPLKNPILCDLLCQAAPQLPWCGAGGNEGDLPFPPYPEF